MYSLEKLEKILNETDPKVLKFNKVHVKTHKHIGLSISKFAL